jgi:hypothetical protein
MRALAGEFNALANDSAFPLLGKDSMKIESSLSLIFLTMKTTCLKWLLVTTTYLAGWSEWLLMTF